MIIYCSVLKKVINNTLCMEHWYKEYRGLDNDIAWTRAMCVEKNAMRVKIKRIGRKIIVREPRVIRQE